MVPDNLSSLWNYFDRKNIMPVVKKLNNSIQENNENKLNLLLLEDHPLVANLEVRSLIQAGFQVKLAKTTEEMINTLNQEKVDVVIMDFLFQKGIGIKEIKNAKLKSLNPKTRFIISSVQRHE